MIDALLEDYGSATPITAGEREMMLALAGTLRADLKLLETHAFVPQARLRVPLVALAGRDDAMVPVPHMQRWRHHTEDAFSLRMFPGGHFFLREEEEAVCALLAAKCSRWATTDRRATPIGALKIRHPDTWPASRNCPIR